MHAYGLLRVNIITLCNVPQQLTEGDSQSLKGAVVPDCDALCPKVKLPCPFSAQQANTYSLSVCTDAHVLYAGAQVESVPRVPDSTVLMRFSGADNNVLNLVLTANVKGLEPLLPRRNATEGTEFQQRLFYVYRLVNVTMEDSVTHGVLPLTGDFGMNENGTQNNPGVPPSDRRVGDWASYVRIQNCTFSNTRLAMVGSSSDGGSLITPIVAASARACMLDLGTLIDYPEVSKVEIVDTTFDNITTSVPPGSGFRVHMLCTDTGDNNDTVTVRDSTFSNINDTLPSHDSLDLFFTSQQYSGRQVTKQYNITRCRFVNITAALLAGLEVMNVMVDNCTVDGAKLAYGGFAVAAQRKQLAIFVNSTFRDIQLGSANDATAMTQSYYNPGVGLVKSGSLAKLNVQGCRFSNVSLLPRATGQQGSTADKSRTNEVGSAFDRTAVIVTAADARVAECTFEDCYTPAVVYAYSGEKETLGLVVQMGTANRAARGPTVSITLAKNNFLRNVYGVYADGFQVQVFSCNFTASIMSGLHVSGVPCLVMARTVLYDAAVSVERASNPGGTAFSLCNKGWFPLWQNGEVGGGSEVPVKARSAALPHVMPGVLADTFDAAVSVYMESVNISGVQGQPALSLHDVHKASLQRINISGSVGMGALGASSVAGLLMLQCQVENNSADLAVDGLNVAGGATFTAVRSLYLLDTVFASNVGPAAGAMLLQSCGAVIINSCKYDNNTSSQSGGAVRAIASDSMVMDTSTRQQPKVIDCLPTDVLGVDYEGFNSGLLDQDSTRP